MKFRRRDGRAEDRVEAEKLAEQVGKQVLTRAPDSLRSLVDVPDRFEQAGRDGTMYQVVVEAWPEDRAGKTLRISVSVDGGGVSAIRPAGWGDTVVLDD